MTHLFRTSSISIITALGFTLWPPITQAQTSGSLLNAKQIAELRKRPMMPVVVPTYLPNGFRVDKLETYRGKYTNGDDELSYQIFYSGADSSCLYVGATQSGPRGMTVGESTSTSLGQLKIYKDPQSNMLAAFPSTGWGTALFSPGYRQGCRSVGSDVFTRIVESIRILK